MKYLFRNTQLAAICLPPMFLAACMSSGTQNTASACPQVRNTEYAPAEIAAEKDPLAHSSSNMHAGKSLYQSTAKPAACAQCHGSDGDGNGPMATMFEPPPRNFACEPTMAGISDGQLYWIIKNGSIGTSMPAFDKLSDKQIWQLVMYIRSFARIPNQKQASN